MILTLECDRCGFAGPAELFPSNNYEEDLCRKCVHIEQIKDCTNALEAAQKEIRKLEEKSDLMSKCIAESRRLILVFEEEQGRLA